MGAIPRLSDGKINLQQPPKEEEAEMEDEEDVVEEIKTLIKVYKDGRVERLPAVADVPCTWSPEPDVACGDAVIAGGLLARLYLPKAQAPPLLLPLLVYFHGGGFCVGSVAWRCYHEFLSRLASRARCAVLSASYRLAPEHRLPAAYEDGLATVRWVQQQVAAAANDDDEEPSWWSSRCDFSRVFLAGDSAGANVAYHVAAAGLDLSLKGLILIQPFFGGTVRTWSEKNLPQPSRSALSLATSDCYWRMALPPGADRDHPWCNPTAKGELEELRLPPALVCAAELDILRDRNMEFCDAMKRAGKRVDQATFAGVGHAFQVLHNYHMSHARSSEMLSLIKDFIGNNRL